MAPDGPSLWPQGNSRRQWLVFYRINEMAMQGGGVIDGRGQKWWDLPCKPHKVSRPLFPMSLTSQASHLLTCYSHETGNQWNHAARSLWQPCCKQQTSSNVFHLHHLEKCLIFDSIFISLLQAIRFFTSSNLIVQGLKIKNSPQFHFRFDNCRNVLVNLLNIKAPAESPNTDGIHVENTDDVKIYNSVVSNGNLRSNKSSHLSSITLHSLILFSWFKFSFRRWLHIDWSWFSQCTYQEYNLRPQPRNKVKFKDGNRTADLSSLLCSVNQTYLLLTSYFLLLWMQYWQSRNSKFPGLCFKYHSDRLSYQAFCQWCSDQNMAGRVRFCI